MSHKSFSAFLNESEEGMEFIAKIKVRGTSNTAEEDLFMQCHDECQWLNKEQSQMKCILFKENLAGKKAGEIIHPLRAKNCLSAPDSLT